MKAIRNSTYALGVPFFFLGVAVVLFATLLFYLEQLEIKAVMDQCEKDVTCAHLDLSSGKEKKECEVLCNEEADEQLVFESIPMAVWFMIVTMTTVGYGDVSPRSTIGKFIASLAAIFGVLFLAMPLAIVGNNFTTIWGDKEKVIFLEKMKESVFQDGITPERVETIFRDMDTDNSGALSFVEFTNFLKRMNINLALNEVRKLWATIDEDRSGMISCEEFIALVFNDDEANVNEDEIDESQKESAIEKTRRSAREGREKEALEKEALEKKAAEKRQAIEKKRKQSAMFTFEPGADEVVQNIRSGSIKAMTADAPPEGQDGRIVRSTTLASGGGGGGGDTSDRLVVEWLGSILLRLPITSYCFLLLPITPSVSCSWLDALNTPSSKLPLSPAVSRFLQSV